jgi:Cu-processing system permease protein
VSRIWVMARVTFREAARKRFLWMALLAGCAFLILFATGLHFQMAAFTERNVPAIIRRQVLSAMLIMGLYAIDLLVVVMTVLTSVDTLAGEIASGTIQAVATKPVRRSELLLGKWLGFAAMLTAFIIIMVGGINAVSYLMSGVTAHHLVRGFALIWMESLLLLSLTLFFGSGFSTLTNGVLTLGLHGLAFIGGWIEQAGAMTQTPKAVKVGVIASVLMPSEALWRRAVFEMQPPLATALQLSPFSGASVPSRAMVVYAAVYTLLFLLLAARRLEKRDL